MARVRNQLHRLYRRGTDRVGVLLGQRDPLTPPQWMFADPGRVDGSTSVRDFVTVGESTSGWLVREGLARHHRVLEVGCGIGRIAIPLARHIETGTYDGIDITRDKVRHCRRTIGRHHPNFRFHHADIFNKYYNPYGRRRASEYRYPFTDDSFDFVFLISLFTHMLPPDVEHYFAEIARVLTPGSKFIATYYLTDEKLGPPNHDYSEVCEVYNAQEPEHGVIYLERHILSLYEQSGFEVAHVHHGSWNRRSDSNPKNRQDIIVASLRP